ncbi:uncharacterized protein LOC105693702 [Athalia rosae]|uniref:uncharacterized protein LOC105693702 n=1 Tax=Athalia rosae TaxID=37344 RepID=UPI000625B590|nr:uncharacterized protein LOC105693702 [Athalia rosae]
MRKSPSKRCGPGYPGGVNLKKPFGFCCDPKNQDPDTRYDNKNPPFKSSMENIFLNRGGPDLKFRIQDIGKPPYPIRREGRRAISGTSLGECSRCRGPLKWYLEDEIALARDMLAHDKQTKYNSDAEKHVNNAIKKAKRRRDQRRKEKRKTESL